MYDLVNVVVCSNGSKAVGDQRLVVAQIADERMLLDELELVLAGRRLEQALELSQVPDAVSRG